MNKKIQTNIQVKVFYSLFLTGMDMRPKNQTFLIALDSYLPIMFFDSE